MNHAIPHELVHRERCCAVIDGARCTELSEVRISDSEDERAAGAYACARHVALVYRAGQVVSFLRR